MVENQNDGKTLADFMPQHAATEATPEGYRASAGESLPADKQAKANMIEVEDALRSVHDPEIPVNIYDLGLIYDIILEDTGDVHITMSLTAPGCPVAGEMPGEVARSVAKCKSVGRVAVDLVWEPAWTKDRMSDDARMALDVF